MHSSTNQIYEFSFFSSPAATAIVWIDCVNANCYKLLPNTRLASVHSSRKVSSLCTANSRVSKTSLSSPWDGNKYCFVSRAHHYAIHVQICWSIFSFLLPFAEHAAELDVYSSLSSSYFWISFLHFLRVQRGECISWQHFGPLARVNEKRRRIIIKKHPPIVPALT